MLVRKTDNPRRNPFRFGDVATGEHFTDREAETAQLSNDLRSGQSVLVISPRRLGKTSLITAVMEKVRKQHVLVAYVDLLRTTTKERFASQLAAALYAGLTPAVERVVHRAGELFQNLPLRPKITLNQDSTPSFEFTAAPGTTDIDQTIDPEPVNPGETGRLENYCVGETSTGLLIQAGPGSGGGTGGWRTKRSG